MPLELEQPSTLLERLSNPQTVERQLIGLTAVSLSHDMQLDFFYDKCKFDKTKNHRSAHSKTHRNHKPTRKQVHRLRTRRP